MTAFDVINLLGGIALFLYGMTIMGAGLEKIAGGPMQGILQKLTSSTLRGVLLGTLITAVIQSSAGTIVIVIGLVNSGIMALPAAVGVIMGANIGTTVTGQLIRLADISGDSLFLTLLKPTTFSPVVAFAGAILYVFFKSPKKRNVGQILMGFGILFTGMSMMDNAVAPLKQSAFFVNAFTNLDNPILGLLVGLAATVAIQSSSASVGILQALTSTGLVTFGSAFPIILGTHVGTAFTPLVAASGANKDAKRSAMIHLYFNLIGSVFFLVVFCILKYTNCIPFLDTVLNKGSVANIHTLSSLVAAVLLLPFANLLVRLSVLTVPDKAGEEQDLSLPVLDERLFNSPAVALQQARSAVGKMAERAAKNYRLAMPLLNQYDQEAADAIDTRENLLDRMEVLVSNYLVKASDHDLNERESLLVNEMIKSVTDFERVGDYAMNIMERAAEMRDKEITFSEAAAAELETLNGAITEITDLTSRAFSLNQMSLAMQVEPLEETVDDMCDMLRTRHIQRLKDGVCQVESGIIFLDLLTNLERISDHCSNVAARLIGLEADMDLDGHALKQRMHQGDVPGFNQQLVAYREKYCDPLLQTVE